MPSNDERRRLAGNMRTFDVFSDGSGRCWLNGTLFGMDVSARSEEGLRNGMAHLASFIEPGDVSGEVCEIEGIGVGEPLPPVVDRDALLSLADDIDRKSNDGTVNPDPMKPIASSLDLFGYASRIREAVGE